MNKHTEQEIAKFDAIANDFWHRNGKFKALHQINPIRLRFVEECTDVAGKRIADIGCGGGILAEALDEKGAQVTGIDLSESGIGAAKAHQKLSGSNVDYRVQSVSDFTREVTNEPLDAVCCMEMLEHVDDPADIVTDCAAMVKTGGVVVFSTINRTLKAHLLAVIMAEYVLGMVPKGTHDPKHFIKPSELQRMAMDAGLTPLEMTGFEFQPLTRDFIRSRNTDINYIFAFQKG